PTLISYLKGVPLPQLHPSLNNLSKLNALIASRKHAEHPYGQNIYGVTHLLMKQSNDENSYIRTINMSFKRVHGSINEWEICAY
ncbi:6949_t:CDS:2, partial [Gigaspora rosea]